MEGFLPRFDYKEFPYTNKTVSEAICHLRMMLNLDTRFIVKGIVHGPVTPSMSNLVFPLLWQLLS